MVMNKLKNLPHIYYFNLDNRSDRRKYMEDQFNYWRVNYTRVSGSKFLSSNIQEWGEKYVHGDVRGVPAYCLSNAVSHLEFIKHWFNTNDDEYLILMEDDYDLNLIEYWNFDWDYLLNLQNLFHFFFTQSLDIVILDQLFLIGIMLKNFCLFIVMVKNIFSIRM